MSDLGPNTIEDPRRWARCIDCGYALVGLDQQHNCPECGRWFDLDIRQTWTFKPPFAFWPYWMPGLVSAAAVGLIGLAIGAAGGAWGWSLWIGVPVVAGCVLGYGLRVYRVLQVIGALILAGSLLLGVISMNLGGIFCGIVFGAFVMIPVFFGMALGALVRRNMKRDSAFRMRDYLPIVLMFVGMLGLFAIERATSGPSPVVTIATTRVIAATPEAC
ncbi:MAG: hypothetical protein KF768_01645 [Phycisphaeraceae bacterium]|nr:hypothetical protein [Phycisphaeraceae bacterium]